jgi:MFS superfamily sulfate permease-like transporter
MTNSNSLNSPFQKFALQDLKAGMVVFLIALPLSLGISLASGAPSTAGLISAALGGILGAYLGGSYVTINGPAAGLIVVVLNAIQSLGEGDAALGFKRMLACVIVVGVLQILSGLLKFGRFAALFPLSVVHGMLSAIGLIIVIKQSHVFFGQKAQGSIINSVLTLPQTISSLNPESSLIGLMSLVLLLIYPYLKLKLTKVIPAPLVVVVLGVLLARYFSSASLVNIPTDITSFFVTPTFDIIYSPASLMAIFSLYFVASLESILSASAVDKLDPLNRESNFDRELWSKGIVNIACGLVGGLPIIAEIVRSSASISQGARSPLANFSHGLYILIFLIVLPALLNMIPLSSLAAILILVGYRLAQPKQVLHMKKLGTGSFISFLTTIILTLVEDLLVGIFAGMLVKVIFSLLKGASLKSILKPDYSLKNEGDSSLLEFEGALIFFSALSQKNIFCRLAQFKQVEIKIDKVHYIDATSLSIFLSEIHKMQKQGVNISFNVPDRFMTLFIQVNNH